MASITSDLARLIVRLGVGGVLAYDGYRKIQIWYQGRAVPVTTGAGSIPAGTPGGRTAGLAAGISEAVGGTMLALGIATPATGAAAASSMALTATAKDAADGPFSGGYEIPAALGVCAGVLALAGPGRISIDHLMGNKLANRPAALASLFATASTTGLVILRRVRGARS